MVFHGIQLCSFPPVLGGNTYDTHSPITITWHLFWIISLLTCSHPSTAGTRPDQREEVPLGCLRYKWEKKTTPRYYPPTIFSSILGHKRCMLSLSPSPFSPHFLWLLSAFLSFVLYIVGIILAYDKMMANHQTALS